MKRLTIVLLLCLGLLPRFAIASPVTFEFSGTVTESQNGGLWAQLIPIGSAINGTFTFDTTAIPNSQGIYFSGGDGIGIDVTVGRVIFPSMGHILIDPALGQGGFAVTQSGAGGPWPDVVVGFRSDQPLINPSLPFDSPNLSLGTAYFYMDNNATSPRLNLSGTIDTLVLVTPEPSTLWLFAVALVGLIAWRKSSQRVMNNCPIRVKLLAIILVGLLPSTLFATEYTFEEIALSDHLITYATGINDNGQVVGFGMTSTSGASADGFLYTNGTYTPLSVPGAISTTPTAINNLGQIVGTYATGTGQSGSFLYSSGIFSTILLPGTTGTWVSDINDVGQIVGNYTDNQGVSHGFVAGFGGYTTIDVAGASSTTVLGINNLGQIVGTFNDPSAIIHPTGFLYANGSFTSFSVSAYGTVLSDINDAGVIVGYNYLSNGYVFNNGVFTIVDHPNANYGYLGSENFSMNNAGQIVGTSVFQTGGTPSSLWQGFVATPVPENSTLILFGLGLIGVAVWGNRRHTVEGPSVELEGTR